MPTISRFYGIDIVMYFNDHLPPHFHAFEGGDEALIEWSPAPRVYQGSLQRSALRRVFDWAALHVDELNADWSLARSGNPLDQIPPLP
jgi:hypothetical protein